MIVCSGTHGLIEMPDGGSYCEVGWRGLTSRRVGGAEAKIATDLAARNSTTVTWRDKSHNLIIYDLLAHSLICAIEMGKVGNYSCLL